MNKKNVEHENNAVEGADTDHEAKRPVKWIQESKNVWRIVYAD